jgi:two-component system, cell cycle response regulator DivK
MKSLLPSLPETSHRSRPPQRSRKNVVLIVDDVQDTREMYAAYFESRSFRPITARDGEQAVAVATSLRPHVIIMDLAMPWLDGIGSIRRLKQNPRTRVIPVILLTGYPDKAVRDGALEAGATVFLTKPCLPEDLEAAVRRLLGRPANPS